MTPLQEIKDKLAGLQHFVIIEGQNLITVNPKKENGFEVSFYDNTDEYIVSFEGWHEHFEKTEKDYALGCFYWGLSDSCRMEIVSRGGVDYKWSIQSYEEGTWITDSTTGLLWCRFWCKPIVRTVQNDIMTEKMA